MSLFRVARTFAGTPGVVALEGVSLDVYAGDFITIAGPSGSGKSTLLNILGLLDRPTSGSYIVDGQPTSSLTDDEASALRAWTIGFVFQSFHLIERRSASSNVALSLRYRRAARRDRRRRAQAALKEVGLSARLRAEPATLSGGERQRVAIARALVGKPRVLLCDEPTGNLDAQTSAEIMDALLRLHADGATLIVVTHDAALAAMGRRRFRMDDGVLTEHGGRETSTTAAESATADQPVQSSWHGACKRSASGLDLPDLAEEVWSSFAAAPLRAWLTALGSLVAVAVLILLSGLAATSAKAVDDRFDELEPTLISVTDATHPAVTPRLEEGARSQILALDGVESVGALWAPEVEFVLRSGTTYDPTSRPTRVRILGVADPPSLESLSVDSTPAGAERLLADDFGEGTGMPQALLGAAAAAEAGLAGDDLPSVVMVGGSHFRVVGLVTSSARSDVIFDLILLRSDAEQIWRSEGIATPRLELTVRVAPGSSSSVSAAIPLVVAPGGQDDVVVSVAPTAASLRRDVEASLSALDTALVLVSFGAGVVGISGVTAAAIVHRTSEFGVRRALGARRRDLRRQVLLEAIMVGTLGGGVGVGLGIAGLVTLATSRGQEPVVDPLLTLSAPFLGMAAGCLAGIYPAIRAGVLEPVRALQG